MHTITIYVDKLSEGERQAPLPAGLNRSSFVYGRYGKPYSGSDSLYFNISHSGSYQVCAVGDIEVGIDIQLVDNRDLEKLAFKLFASEAYDNWQQQEDRRISFYREWTRKEAYLKWTGEGITRDLRTLEMDGHETEVAIDPAYVCILWTGEPVDIILKRED